MKNIPLRYDFTLKMSQHCQLLSTTMISNMQHVFFQFAFSQLYHCFLDADKNKCLYIW